MLRNLFSKPAVVEVTAEQARKKQQAGAVIVDVREPYELREGVHPRCSAYSPEESLTAHERA
jgi:rhodanese-related sulfurtransferase